ncbi:MAG: hypothetical protein AAF415_16090 [Pseudomonadota bacterium]
MLENLTWAYRLRRLVSQLEQDRQSLLTGRTERLAKADRRREEAERELQKLPGDVAERHALEIQRIQRLASRNQSLLAAYLEGARDAAKRLANIDNTQRGIGAYGRNGVRIDPAETRATRERRA